VLTIEFASTQGADEEPVGELMGGLLWQLAPTPMKTRTGGDTPFGGTKAVARMQHFEEFVQMERLIMAGELL
jgi:hypothetical protein